MNHQKKLYRDEENQMIAGVCKGLADYFGSDASLIRILAVLALFFSGGSALIAYIVMYAIIPTKRSLVDKGEIVDDEKADPKDDYTINPDDYKL